MQKYITLIILTLTAIILFSSTSFGSTQSIEKDPPSLTGINYNSIKKSELFMHLTMSQDRNNGLEKENTALRKKNLELKKRIALLEKGARKRLVEIEKEDSIQNITTKAIVRITDTTLLVESNDIYQPSVIKKQLTAEQALGTLKELYRDKQYKTKQDSMAWYHITQDSIKQAIMGADDPLVSIQFNFTRTRIACQEVRAHYKKLKKVEIDKNLPKEERAKVRERLKEAKTKAKNKKKKLRKKIRALKGSILELEHEKMRGLNEKIRKNRLVNSG